MFDTVSDIIFIILISAVVILIAVVWPIRRKHKKRDDAREAREVKAQAGARGEKSVEDALEKTLREKYIFRDIVIDFHGFTHEIDFLVVTRAGVSVVEVKNWAPQVYGNIGDDEWTQVNVRTKERHSYKNPLKQNEGHVRAVESIVPYRTPIYAYTVFVRGNVIGDARDAVISPHRLAESVASQKEAMSSKKALKLSRQIMRSRSMSTRSEHIQSIQKARDNGIFN